MPAEGIFAVRLPADGAIRNLGKAMPASFRILASSGIARPISEFPVINSVSTSSQLCARQNPIPRPAILTASSLPWEAMRYVKTRLRLSTCDRPWVRWISQAQPGFDAPMRIEKSAAGEQTVNNLQHKRCHAALPKSV
jgi:hypothetical protein